MVVLDLILSFKKQLHTMQIWVYSHTQNSFRESLYIISHAYAYVCIKISNYPEELILSVINWLIQNWYHRDGGCGEDHFAKLK